MNIYPRAHYYLVIGLVIAIAGFVPSYWSRDLGEFRPSIHIHGIAATLWFLTLIVQPWFIKNGSIRTHRRYGIFALMNAVILVVTTAWILPGTLEIPFESANLAYMFVYWDVATLSLFVAFVCLAMKHRKNVQLHSRYMIATVFIPMLPALARGLFFYGVIDSFISALYIGNALTLMVVTLLIIDDHKKGRLYAPYLSLYAVLAFFGVSIEVVGSAPWWQSFVDAAFAP